MTGSMHLIHAPRAKVLLDCGLYQGRRHESLARNRNLPINIRELDAVCLSHAHIDHSGALPLLYKKGYRGPIYATPATVDLCTVMLADAAMIQESDARYINKQNKRDGTEQDPVEALYDADDVKGVLTLFRAVPYRHKVAVAEGVEVTFLDAGHVLGSAIVALDVDDVGQTKRVVFTGDLGRYAMPILEDPEIPDNTSFLITESTYGDREHDPIESTEDALLDIIQRTFDRGGKVVIPSFALERAQEIVFSLKRLHDQGRLPKIPVYVDSPLTVKITEVFRKHPECYDEEARLAISGDQSPFDFEGLRYVESVEDSKAIDRSKDPAIIISASGMCEFGRVVHHLKATLGHKDNSVVIVGWQAPHTLGRRLVEGRSRVRVFGVEQERRAEVRVLNGFSAHAGQAALLRFAEAVRDRGPLRHVALVHGEIKAMETLAALLDERRFPSVSIPEPGTRIRH